MARDTAGGTQSVERALGLLRHFTDGRPELRVTELVQLSGLGQSTVSRLLGTLEAAGYVERDEQSGLFRLGRDLITLAGTSLNQSPIHREGRQIAQSLACSLGLGVNVAERRGSQSFYLLNFEGRLAPRAFTLIGRRSPLHATALGKALVSELSDEQLSELLSSGTFTRYTSNTAPDVKTLAGELTQVRSRGYATEVEELAFGRACIAAPIRDRSGHVVAALSISGPLSALDLDAREAELASHVIENADQVSIGLGYVVTATMAETSR